MHPFQLMRNHALDAEGHAVNYYHAQQKGSLCGEPGVLPPLSKVVMNAAESCCKRLKFKEETMKRNVILMFLVSLMIAGLSGCLVSQTPKSPVTLKPCCEESQIFAVNGFANTSYTWYKDNVPFTDPSMTSSPTFASYTYTPKCDYVGTFVLKVVAKSSWPPITKIWTVNVVNNPPIADAGSAQSIFLGTTAQLDGSASYDPDGSSPPCIPLTYTWSKTLSPPGSTAELSDPAIVNPTFTPDLSGEYEFKLVVCDCCGLCSEAKVVITVNNLPISIKDLLNSMVNIPCGNFQIGSTDDEIGWAKYTTPVHEVTLPCFEIGAYEVTQAQYEAVMGVNPSHFQGPSFPNSENNPVEMVTRDDALEFCTKLSVMTGRTFMLPSEAQWEYSCRAGSTTLYSFGDSDPLLNNYAWYYTNSGNKTHPVGTKLHNNWNLYDMHGNVYEWVLDSWHSDYTGAPTDGSAWDPELGPPLVIRGGSWNSYPAWCRSAFRYFHPNNGYSYLGFRVVIDDKTTTVPIANAGSDKPIAFGQMAQLDGSLSYDLCCCPLTYEWMIVSKPVGSTAIIVNPTSVNPTITPDIKGAYMIQLIVYCGTTPSVHDTITITAN